MDDIHVKMTRGVCRSNLSLNFKDCHAFDFFFFLFVKQVVDWWCPMNWRIRSKRYWIIMIKKRCPSTGDISISCIGGDWANFISLRQINWQTSRRKDGRTGRQAYGKACRQTCLLQNCPKLCQTVKKNGCYWQDYIVLYITFFRDTSFYFVNDFNFLMVTSFLFKDVLILNI